MRRLAIAALLAVPLLLIPSGKAEANPNPPTHGYGCGDFCLGLFKNIHQHGPLFNYGPYYGYYPFAPYGPWDAYLRYDPFFYGDPYANWVPRDQRNGGGSGRDGGGGDYYGRNPRLRGFSLRGHGFAHASWLHGGWFRGHEWLHGGLHHSKSCSSCGGIATATSLEPTGDVTERYSGVGSADQSAVFYSATPTLNPVLDLLAVSPSK